MARIRPARHYQRKDEPVRLVAENAKPGIRRDIKASLKHLSSMVPDSAVELARAGLWYRLKDEVAWGHFQEILRAPFNRIGKTFEAGAGLGVRKINGAFAAKRRTVQFRKMLGHSSATLEAMVEVVQFHKALGDRFNFDVYTPPTQEIIRKEQDRLIGDLTAQARDSIDAAIMFGARNGFSPEEIVSDIRNVIGLSEQLANAAMNYEAALRNLDSAALARQLRNTEMDTAVRDAMDAGVPLSEDQIQALTGNYIDNALDYRAAMIAQTESVRAASLGLQDAYQQAVDRGAVPEDAVTLNWQVALDERTCPVCLSIPDMNPDGIAMGEQFDSIDGPVDLPPVHPNCRCSVEYVTDLDKVPSDAFA